MHDNHIYVQIYVYTYVSKYIQTYVYTHIHRKYQKISYVDHDTSTK